MKLYGSGASPFVQRVLAVVRAKGGELELAPLPGGSMQSPEFAAISPMGRIPLLALDDGTHICESSAIAAYLDETLSGPKLMPDAPIARARVREVEAVATLEIGGGVRPVMVHRVFGRPGAPEIVDAAFAQAEKGFAALEHLLAEGDAFVVGNALTTADCTLMPILTLIRIIDPIAKTGALIDARPKVAAYEARAASHPVLARSINDMREGFAAITARSAAPATA
jgi:glutathione S-transferase